MTTTEKNQRIAEACGWRVEFKANPWDETDPEEKKWEVVQPNGWSSRRSDLSALPNYFTDLNAMHEAEKTMKDYHWYPYRVRLDKWSMIKERGYIGSIHATAAQRAEAFGLTLGLWKEGE